MTKMQFDIIGQRLADLKVKYLFMDKFFGNAFKETRKTKKIDTINIYISLESLYNKFRRPQYEKLFEDLSKRELKEAYRTCISEFINVAAHYRKYFTRHKVMTNIIYYYNFIEDDAIDYNNTPLCNDYRLHWFNSVHNMDRWAINNMVFDSIPFMNIICEYLEDVYMVGTKRVESSIIPFIFEMEGYLPANMNIIISSDPYDFQYTNYNSLLITKYENEPFLITKKNVIPFMNYWKGSEFEPDRIINPLLLTFILSCIGDKKRSIRKISGLGYRSVYKDLMKLYDAGYLFDENEETFHISNLLHVLNGTLLSKYTVDEMASTIMTNYNVTNFEYQYKQVSSTQKKKLEDQIVDKIDSEALLELNDKYFSGSPLMLEELNQYNKNEGNDPIFM